MRAAMLAVSVVLLLEGSAAAQCPEEDRRAIYELNRKALEAYENLDFEKAKTLLAEAFEKAKGTDCAFDWVHAYTLMNLGILSIGAYGKTKLGLRFFESALRVRPEASLDPRLATPKMKKLFELARRRMKIVEEPAPWPKPKPTVRLRHEPPRFATAGRALTLRVEAQGEPKQVKLFYRYSSEETFHERDMEQAGQTGTWKTTLEGERVRPGMLQYYFEAYDESSTHLANAGDPSDPYELVVRRPPRRPRVKPRKPRPSKPHRIWLFVGTGWGFGYAQGHTEVLDEEGGVAADSGLPRDRIEEPGLAPGSVGLSLEAGYLVTPSVLLSLQGYVGMIGPLAKGVAGAKPVDGWAFLRVSYLSRPLAGGWLRVLAGGGVGFAVVRHLVDQSLTRGSFRDTDLGMGIAPALCAGLVFGRWKHVAGYLGWDLFLAAWTDTELFTFHSDLTLGVAVSL